MKSTLNIHPLILTNEDFRRAPESYVENLIKDSI